jgi:hypothetical protein
MRTLFLAGALALAMVAVSSTEGRAQQGTPCNIGKATTHGCLLTANVRSPGAPGPEASGSRTGEACAWNLLRLVAMGDVRVETAKANGGITKVSSIDSKTFELIPYWGVFTRYCTVVSGN